MGVAHDGSLTTFGIGLLYGPSSMTTSARSLDLPAIRILHVTLEVRTANTRRLFIS